MESLESGGAKGWVWEKPAGKRWVSARPQTEGRLRKLVTRFVRFFRNAERRRAPRRKTELFEAVYWNGAAAVRRKVYDISAYGAHLETSDRWYPGTLLQMQLVVHTADETAEEAVTDMSGRENGGEHEAVAGNPAAANDVRPESLPAESVPASGAAGDGVPAEAKPIHVSLNARVVRHVADGMCLEFIFQDWTQHHALQRLLFAAERAHGGRSHAA